MTYPHVYNRFLRPPPTPTPTSAPGAACTPPLLPSYGSGVKWVFLPAKRLQYLSPRLILISSREEWNLSEVHLNTGHVCRFMWKPERPFEKLKSAISFSFSTQAYGCTSYSCILTWVTCLAYSTPLLWSSGSIGWRSGGQGRLQNNGSQLWGFFNSSPKFVQRFSHLWKFWRIILATKVSFVLLFVYSWRLIRIPSLLLNFFVRI